MAGFIPFRNISWQGSLAAVGVCAVLGYNLKFNLWPKEQAKPGSRCGLPGEGCVAEHGRSNTEQDNEARAMKQLVRAREMFVRLVRN